MKTMIKRSALVLLLAATAAPAFAASTVLTIDFGRVFQESAAAKSGTSQLRAKYEPVITQRQTAFNTAVQAFNTQQTTLQAIKAPAQPTPAQVATYRQAGERAQAAQESLNQVAQEQQAVGRYVEQQIVDKVTPIAEQIRGERKAEVVVPKGSVLAADPTGDITAVVIQRLDASFPNPSITLPNAQTPAQGAGR